MIKALPARFSDEQLRRIIGEAMIYMCACPAQVASQIQTLRELYDYQRKCADNGPLSEQVHARIAAAARQAHAELEQCLDDVLGLEGWDKTALTMPEGLRQLRDQMIDNDLN